MKKTIALVIMLVSMLITVSAAATQKLYDYDSSEYQMTKSLTAAAGVVGPSSATPVTGHELIIALDRIDRGNLSGTANDRLDDLYARLSNADNSFQMDIDFSITPQLFLTVDQAGDAGTVDGRNDFFLPYSKEDPFLSLGAKFDFGDNVFLEAVFPILNGPIGKGMTYTSFDWLVSYRESQWQFAGNKNNPAILAEIPFIARGAFGNDWVNLIIGRTRHQMGSGYTGNMVVGDNYPYQELLKLSATSNVFTYNMSLTEFGTQITPKNPKDATRTEFEKTHFGGNHMARVIHRFDFTIVNRVRLAINFGATYYSTSAFDFRFFSPFMIAHNYYNNSAGRVIATPHDEANNIFSLELEAAITPGLSLGVQFVLDQFQMAHETDPLPNAFGLLFNLAWTEELEHSSYTVWGEAVYTSAYLYRNEKYNTQEDMDSGLPNYNYDWILGYFANDYQAENTAYSGYPTGPDTIAMALGVSYRNYEHSVTATGRLMYSLIGENGGPNGLLDPVFRDFTGKNTPTGTVWHSVKLEGGADWTFLDTLHLFGGGSLQYHVNYKNDSSSNAFVPQFFLGLKWQPI